MTAKAVREGTISPGPMVATSLALSGYYVVRRPPLNGSVHASAACTWARRPGRRRGSWHPAWRARLPGRVLIPALTGTCRGILPGHVRRSAGPEFGSDPASYGYLGPIN